VAHFKYVGVGPKGEAQERTFDAGIGHALVTVRTGDTLEIAGPAQMHHAMNVDLQPGDDATRRRVEFLREQVRIADSRAGTPKSGGI
jgi:hypothetical protein